MSSRRLGKAARERGLTSEKRVLEACKLEKRPQWMLRARRATRIEDHSGIDVVVETDVGSLAIQVKSSEGGKAHFRPRPLISVGIVVVREDDSPKMLLDSVVSQLRPIRASHLKALEKLGVKRLAAPKRQPPVRAKAKPAKEAPIQMTSTEEDPPATGEPSWTELRDCLLAALLGAAARRPPSDDEIRIATEALAKRSVRVAEIAARFPAVFHRAEDGSLCTTLDLAQAYRLRLARYWEPAPREVMRRVLVGLSSTMDGQERVVLSDLPKQIAAVVKDGISEREVSHVLQMVRRAEGWEIVSIAGDSKRHVRPKPWLRDPVQAEAHIDDAAVAVMGPFAPVDRAAMAAALSWP